MHNTRQGVAEPALSQHSPDEYERAAQHQQFWSDEPLTQWQEFILCRELDCSRRRKKNCLRSKRRIPGDEDLIENL